MHPVDKIIQEVVGNKPLEVVISEGLMTNIVKKVFSFLKHEFGDDLGGEGIRNLIKGNHEIKSIVNFADVYDKSLQNIMKATQQYVDDKEAVTKIHNILRAAITAGKGVVYDAALAAQKKLSQAIEMKKAALSQQGEQGAPEDKYSVPTDVGLENEPQTITASFHRIGFLMTEGPQKDAPGTTDPAPKSFPQILKAKKEPLAKQVNKKC